MTLTDEQFKRLPKYAQHELRRLEANLAHAEAKLAVGPADSNTFAGAGLQDDGRPLGRDTPVEFRLDDYDEQRGWEKRISVRVGRELGGSFIYVHGGQGLSISPESSNVVKVGVER